MKTPTEILKEEHVAVLAKLAALEDILKNLDKREQVSAGLKELAAFFEVDFWVHFDKEERALFPEFDSFMPHGVGPLAAMLDEHELLRDTNTVVQEAVAKYLAGDDSAETVGTIRQDGMHFIEFLRGHITKEDGLLFRMAEMHLNQQQNEKVARLFSEMDQAAKR
jgi:hemerythrin-like domain-containing protein